MTAIWKLRNLQTWIEESRHPSPIALDLIRSLSRGAFIIKYHKITAKKALQPYLESEDDHTQMLAAMVSFDKDFCWAALTYEANLIACIHSVRNYADLVSQLINALAATSPTSIDECTIGKTILGLPPSKLQKSLEELKDFHWFKYLGAFSNTAKHRQLISNSPTISFSDNARGIKIAAFKYKLRSHKEQNYPIYWGHEVLDGAWEVYIKLLECGAELNRFLSVENHRK